MTNAIDHIILTKGIKSSYFASNRTNMMMYYFKKLKFPIIFWGSFILFTLIVIAQFEGIAFALKLSFIYFLPLTIPVHLHEYVFEKYFINKKLLIYSILTLAIIACFGFLIDQLEKVTDPKGDNSTIASIIVIIFIYMGIKYFIGGTKQQLRLKELEAKQSQAELDLLKSQINPHFLFNSLNSIYSLTLKNSQKSSEAVILLSDLMRYILETSKKNLVPLKEEIDFISNYIKLEEIRLGSSMLIDYRISGNTSNLYITPMILIAFVENVFKHGVGMNQMNNNCEIKIEIDNKILKFTCTNSIVQKSNDLEKKVSQTGMENVKRRLELIYPEKHDLTIERINGKFQVNLLINLTCDVQV